MSAQTRGFVIGFTIGMVATYWYVSTMQAKSTTPRTQG